MVLATFCANVLSKPLNALCRSKLFAQASVWMLPTQIGGRPGGGTDLASHIFRGYQAWTHVTVQTLAAIFVDLTSAFYRVIRSLIVRGGSSDESIPWVLVSRLKILLPSLATGTCVSCMTLCWGRLRYVG